VTQTLDARAPEKTAARTGWLVVGQSVIRTGQIAIAVLLVKLLAPSEWNSIALALTIYLAAVTIGSFNLEHSILYFLPTLTKDQAERLFAKTVRSLAGVGLFAAGIIVLIARQSTVLSSSNAGVLIAITVACELPTVIAGPALISRGRVRDAGLWDCTFGILQFACVVLPAVFARGADGVLQGLALASVLRLMTFLFIFRRDVVTRWDSAEAHLFRRQILYCAPLGVALATGVLTRTIDKWFVAWKIPSSVGIYAIAAQEVPVLAVLPYASGAVIAVAMVKHFMDGDYRSSFQLWSQQVRTMCRPVIALTFLVVCIAPEVFDIALAPIYQESVLSFQIFTVIGIHRVTEYGAVLRAVGRTKEIVMSSVILLALNACFAGAGLFMYGIVGLTIGSVLAFAVAWIWMLSRVADVFHLSLRQVFPWATWSSFVVYFGAIGIASEILSGLVVSAYGQLLIKVLVMFVGYRVSNTVLSSPQNPLSIFKRVEYAK
jgi:O-antigen/teichoic acid export membrane protein